MTRRTRKFFSYCLVVRLCHKRWQRLNLKATPVGDNAAVWIIHIAKEASNRKHSGNKTNVDKEYLKKKI